MPARCLVPGSLNLNFCTSPYFRTRLADGSLAWSRPADFAAQGGRRPVGFAFGHMLLDAFATELLIALYQHALAPESEDGWHDLWEEPPGPDEVAERLAAAADGFDLYGDAPAFQDKEAAGVEPSPIARLLPVMPGEQGRRRNQDILLPDIGAMRPEVAMVALAFVQAHSPAGGRGTRTSLTGGGPLRTWVEAPDGDVFRTVIANLLPRDRFDALGTRNGIDALPWRASLRGKRTAANTPPEHLLFSCPRRLLLAPPESPDPDRACDVTGDRDVPLVTAVHQKADGPDYESTGFRHPMTPYVYRKDKGAMAAYPRLAATLAQGTAWRERAGLFAARGGPGMEGPVPASVVSLWTQARLHEVAGMDHVRLRAFGLRCDNAKVLGLVDGEFVFRVAPAGHEAAFDEYADRQILAGQGFARLLRAALAEAQLGPAEREKAGFEFGAETVEAFWSETGAAFDRHLGEVARAIEGGTGWGDPALAELGKDFRGRLHRRALDLFDGRCFALLSGPRPERAAEARNRLLNFGRALVDPDAQPRKGKGRKPARTDARKEEA